MPIRKIIVYSGTRPIGNVWVYDKGKRVKKAEMYCPVNLIVGTLNPEYNDEDLEEIAYALKLRLEGDSLMGISEEKRREGAGALFRSGVEIRKISIDEYIEMSMFLDKYNERARECFGDPNFDCAKHIWSEMLICGGADGIINDLIRNGTYPPSVVVEPLTDRLKTEEVCEACFPDFHSLYILRDIAPFDSCKLFKIGGWSRETDRMPL